MIGSTETARINVAVQASGPSRRFDHPLRNEAIVNPPNGSIVGETRFDNASKNADPV
jgi:hypothetical protein